MVRDIPGFYYDAERGKYFKIQPNHAGPGQQHSRQVIEDIESATKRRKITHEHLARQREELVSRSRLLTHPLLGRLSLRNQLGESGRRALPPDPNEDLAAFYAANLSENPVYSSDGIVPEFVVDERNGAIIFAHSHSTGQNDTLHCLRPIQPGYYRGMPHIFEAMPTSFVGMSINAESQKLLYASNAPWGTRTVLLDVPRIGEDPHASVVNQVWNANEETAWQIAASPRGGSFAVASTHGLRVYNVLSEQTSRILYPTRDAAFGEFKAVAFGKDDRLAMVGTRSGLVIFLDLRTKDLVARLRHQDGVSAIRMIDDNRVVVRGLQKMSLYDLRYTEAPSKKQIKSKIVTNPYRVFPWETTFLDFQSGFDYNPELGIIATGSCRTIPASNHLWPSWEKRQEIHIFSVRTGKKLPMIQLPHGSGPVTCIKFSRIRSTFGANTELKARDNEPLSLLATSGGCISEWSCQGGIFSDDSDDGGDGGDGDDGDDDDDGDDSEDSTDSEAE